MRRPASRVALMSGEGALEVFQRARELEKAGRSIIHLELGEPDFHPAAPVVEAAARAMREGRDRYTASEGLPALRAAITDYLRRTRNLNVTPESVIVAPGCKIALFLAMMALVEPGDEVLHPEPSFPIYPSMTRALGATPVPFRLLEANGFQPNLDEIAAKSSPRTRLLILNSPNNPTGTVFTPEAQRRLAQLAVERDWHVLSDEIYARIVYSGEYASISALPGMAERTVIIDGFSKSFAMTGWRLGYAVAPQEIVAALNMLAVNSFTSVAEFTQIAAIEALADTTGSVAAAVAAYARRREMFIRGLAAVPGFRCRPPEGAFYAWVNIEGTGLPAAELCRLLLEEAGVAAIPGAAFGPSGENFIRFSFAGPAALLGEAVERIRKLSARWQAPARARKEKIPC